jgi:hypothetical protein
MTLIGRSRRIFDGFPGSGPGAALGSGSSASPLSDDEVDLSDIHTAPKEGACMAWSNVRIDGLLEIAVMLFQVFGVATLCLTRLFPATRWADRGRVGFVFALVGLGVFGAICGRFDSEFALFAGGTMTALLIGMIAGTGTAGATAPAAIRIMADPKPLG